MKQSVNCFRIPTLIFMIFMIYSCIQPDYFTRYDNKNLVSHFDFTDWARDQDSTYMDWAEVSAAAAGGTSGLPDESAKIYRLEMKNLVPGGDFGSAATIADAGWTVTGGSLSLATSTVLGSRALAFTIDSSGEYAEFKLDSTAVNNSSYLFRFDLTSTNTGSLAFQTKTDISSPEYKPSIKTANHIYRVPEDFEADEIPSTEFSVYDNSTDSFRIIYSGGNTTGYVDNFRIVKTDQTHYSRLSLPYTDENRVDDLALIGGTYRFSIYVKADPQAGSGNHYAADAVTLLMESFDDQNPSSVSTPPTSFSSSDYSGFSEWTKLSVDMETQITIPEDGTSTVLRLSVCPGDARSTASLDACSILLSNPSLCYSADGTF